MPISKVVGLFSFITVFLSIFLFSGLLLLLNLHFGHSATRTATIRTATRGMKETSMFPYIFVSIASKPGKNHFKKFLHPRLSFGIEKKAFSFFFTCHNNLPYHYRGQKGFCTRKIKKYPYAYLRSLSTKTSKGNDRLSLLLPEPSKALQESTLHRVNMNDNDCEGSEKENSSSSLPANNKNNHNNNYNNKCDKEHDEGINQDKSDEKKNLHKSGCQSKNQLESSLSINPLNQRPYFFPNIHVIGLTGGIAAGKSSACKFLESKGLSIIDADKLGHEAYLPGTKGFDEITKCFGYEEIVDSTNGTIDRVKLGSLVFSDRKKMKELTDIIWPIIAEMARQKIEQLAETGSRCVIVEAAILLEASWDASLVDEVWCLGIPEKEAVRRIMKRNAITEDQALQRIRAQLSNESRRDKSLVFIDSSGEKEVTRNYLDKEYKHLRKRLQESRGFDFDLQ